GSVRKPVQRHLQEPGDLLPPHRTAGAVGSPVSILTRRNTAAAARSPSVPPTATADLGSWSGRSAEDLPFRRPGMVQLAPCLAASCVPAHHCRGLDTETRG